MFDSPFAICPRCNAPVLLDQTQRECAAEHQCNDKQVCPLERYFSGHDFSGNLEVKNSHEKLSRPA